MARWEPNARERLVRAAVDLFTEQGYDATTVTQIADRAGGLTKTTFFRHFQDKREVLFAGQELHVGLLAEGVAAAPPDATPLEAVALALDALAGSFTEDLRDIGARLQPLIAANPELQERSVYKRGVLVEAMAGALRERGVPEDTANVAGAVGMLAFGKAFDTWAGMDDSADPADPADRRRLVEHTREAFAELREAVTALG
jgi:AcrR family transcriptional regulator